MKATFFAKAAFVSLLSLAVACGSQQSGVRKLDTSIPDSVQSTTTTTSTTTTRKPSTPIQGVDAADGVGDPYFPLLGNGGFDVEHYAIELVVPDIDGEVQSTTTITAKATAALRSFHLDYSGPKLSAVTVEGLAASHVQSGADLLITPAQPIPIGEFSIVISYTGLPESELVDIGFPIEVGWTRIGGSIVSIGQPFGSSKWLPSSDHPSDKATYSFEITVPRGTTAVANGQLIEIQASEETTTYQWEMTVPMATNVATVAIGSFEFVSSESPGGISILDAVPLGGDKQIGAIETTGPMLDRFVERFGPYPFESYGSLVVDTFLGFALEQQGRSLFGTDLIGSESVIAHELGHQWFGDSVSPSTWQDVWLNEGFATYSEWWWDELQGQGTMRSRAESVLAQITQKVPALSFPPAKPGEELFGRTVYLRGGAALVALELHLGTEVFDRLVAKWLTTYKDSDASTDDFLGLVNDFGGTGALDLFRPWVLGGGTPTLPA